MHSKETQIFIVLLLAFLLLAVIFGYYVFTIMKAYRNEIARRKKFLFDEIRVLESERERIAQNLHDSAGPELSLLKLNLDGIETKDDLLISQSKNHIDRILSNLRDISHNLMPNLLIRESMVAAIEDLAHRMSNRGLSITCEGEVNFAIPKELSIHIYRMMEEFIYNTIKHANATQMKIVFRENKDSLEVIAGDNGVGFDLNLNHHSTDGIGLRGFEYRTEMIGGSYSLLSEPGKGTQLHIILPITQ